MGEFLIVADLKMAVRMVIEPPFEVPKRAIDMAMGTGTEQHKLAALVEAVGHRLENEVHALLMIEAADERNQGLEFVAQPKPASQRRLIRIFFLGRLETVTLSNVLVHIRVPHI